MPISRRLVFRDNWELLPFDRLFDEAACIQKLRLTQSRTNQLQTCDWNLSSLERNRNRQRWVAGKIYSNCVLDLKNQRIEHSDFQIDERNPGRSGL